ncbi:MAG: hypothetical protein ACK5HY_09310, partial [Parahaliea sp.]
MELDELAINARQRGGWSAIDLGWSLARRWWRTLLLSWLVPAALVFCVFHLLLFKYPTVAFLLTWWLKPLYDRFPLYILSRQLFGEDVSLSACLRNWRAICGRDALTWLTWWRFNPMRSFVLPVTLLEGLRGERRKQRLMVLQFRNSGYAFWLTTICIHI